MRTGRSAMMKPRVCRFCGGMVTGAAAALLLGKENLIKIPSTCHKWFITHLVSDTFCHTTDLMDTAFSNRGTGSSAARAVPTGLPFPPLHRCCHCRRPRHCRCLGSVFTASRVREQAVSGSGATARWVGLGTEVLPTGVRGTGTEDSAVVGTTEVPVVASDPERFRATENVSFLIKCFSIKQLD